MERNFYICKCFYTRNIFLKDLKLHIEYRGRDHFLRSFSDILKENSICSKLQQDELIAKIELEIDRRRRLQEESLGRRKIIERQYKPLHPHLYNFKETYLAPELLRLVEFCRDDEPTFEELCQQVQETDIQRTYAFPVFTEEFCQQFLEEIQNFEKSSLPKGRPNTMNRYGVLLDELGFNPFFTTLREQYLSPLTRLLYPDWGGGQLDSHKVFIVQYREGEDTDLDYHYDNAEVTLNVSLTPESSYTGGELYFGAMRMESEQQADKKQFKHVYTHGLLHRGQHRHGALPILSGERYNLILWMRASCVRNMKCPMCDREPDLQEVEGFGDGFTKPQTVDVCSVI